MHARRCLGGGGAALLLALLVASAASGRDAWDACVDGEGRAAVAACRDRVARAPASADAHYNLGVALWHAGEPTPALRAFRSALSLEPRHARAHAGVARALADAGREAEAGAHLAHAVSLAPADAELRLLHASHLLLREGDLEGAESGFADVLRLVSLPGGEPPPVAAGTLRALAAGAHRGLAACLTRRHRVRAAIPHLVRATELAPASWQAFHELGEAWRRIGACRESLAALAEARRLEPEAPVAAAIAWCESALLPEGAVGPHAAPRAHPRPHPTHAARLAPLVRW